MLRKCESIEFECKHKDIVRVGATRFFCWDCGKDWHIQEIWKDKKLNFNLATP